MEISHITVFIAISAVAIANSLYFGALLFTMRKKSVSNLFLSLILIALAVRIGKSVIALTVPDASLLFPIFGLIGMVSIGPLVLLYFKSLNGMAWSRHYLFHFIPILPLMVLMIVPFEPIIYSFYQFSLVQMFAYLVASMVYLKQREISHTGRVWVTWLLAGLVVIWLTFFFQLVLENYISYFAATSTALLVLYVLGFRSMKRQRFYYGGINKNRQKDSLVNQLSDDIRKLFEQEKVYRDFEITIQKVARRLMVQPYLISKVINEQFQKSFPELVNEYRVNEVKEKLHNPGNHHLNIESIGFDSGFVTPSVFYTNFKKITGKTPSQYRKDLK